MKIYFIGSHSVGKTTLARYVSEKYKLPMITEVARAILSEKELHLDSLRYDLNMVDNYQESIFFRQIDEEAKHKAYVSDRCLLDVLAYSAQHARILSELMMAPELKTYITMLKEPDSILYFVRPSKATMKADGVREALDWDGVVAIDAQIKMLLEMFGLRYFQINMDNMQERVRLVDAVLNVIPSV